MKRFGPPTAFVSVENFSKMAGLDYYMHDGPMENGQGTICYCDVVIDL
jgi:hypothetical protein